MWAAASSACATRPPLPRGRIVSAAAASTSSAARGGGGGGGRGSSRVTGAPSAGRTGQRAKPAAGRGRGGGAARPPVPGAPPPPARAAPPKKKPSSTAMPSTVADPAKEAHKLFDEVTLRVRAGKGGRGEVAKRGGGRVVKNFKYAPGGRKGGREVFLSSAPPADGAQGGDVVVMADPAVASLLHLHGGPDERTAPDGQAGNPARGSAGPRPTGSVGATAARACPRPPPLILRVPPGTVVRRGPGGPVLGEVVLPGQRLVVARGGAGGPGVVGNAASVAGLADTAARRRRRGGSRYVFDEEDDGSYLPEDDGGDPSGLPGEAATLHLLLRVVADVGLVGAPNAGKSSLLAALTAARPEVGAHPFTTLMPNLGVLSAAVAADGDTDGQRARELGLTGTRPPVLADLPGLIPGAHAGRGLGRAFLRHARRAAALLHVVDGSAPDPARAYREIRRELALYNPAYAARPHVVAFNKTDLIVVSGGSEDSVREALEGFTAAVDKADAEEEEGAGGEGAGLTIRPRQPLAVVPTSAVAGVGLATLAAALENALKLAKVEAAEEAERGAVAWDEKKKVETTKGAL